MVTQDLSVVDTDLRLIANLPSLRQYLDRATPENRNDLANFFLLLAQQSGPYDKVRYLYSHGEHSR